MNTKQLSILHINKFHHIFGGSEAVYFRTADILESYGHKSIFYSMNHPNNLECITDKYFMPFIDIDKAGPVDFLMAICRNIYSFKARNLVSKLLDEYHVDIVHLHNIHRQMSPSILYEFKKRRIPVVMTLHEYKMICPSYIMVCNDKPCEACRDGKYFYAMKLRCVKGSFLRSALLSVEMYIHHKLLDIYNNVDIFIAPSLFLKKKHEELGFKKKIINLPYAIDSGPFDEYCIENSNKDNDLISFVYFGRLVPDKGLFTLVESLRILALQGIRSGFEVKIIGDGPIRKKLESRLQGYGIDNVKFMGFMTGKKLFAEIAKSDIVIIPSEWYENYPVSVMEAFALRKPVIGARIGGIPEMVKDNETGYTFESGNPVDLGDKIKYLLSNSHKISEMGKSARQFIKREVNPERHYRQLMEIYREAISYKFL